ncbi:MAG: class I SAM-dependent methyltransferase [Ruminococcus sp.]|nr:class I SAM-dependent methyltransferase [Ruminococcus sp.]
MLNLKLKTIATLISANDYVIDIACDHAYLAIYLKDNDLCQNVLASDISKSALNNARNNIKKSNLAIKTYLSDGFKDIDDKNVNTAIISGVGTNTIIDIINNAPSNIIKYIISSNNNHDALRKYMLDKNFYIKKELIVKEKDKYYPIMLFTKEETKENKYTLKYGKSDNLDYFNYLLAKEKDILIKIPLKHIIKRLNTKRNIKYLNKIIKNIRKSI